MAEVLGVVIPAISTAPAGTGPAVGNPSFYAGGAILSEVRVTHPLAVVEAVEDSLVSVGIPEADGSRTAFTRRSPNASATTPRCAPLVTANPRYPPIGWGSCSKTGPVDSKEIPTAAKQSGIAWRTIERAKTRLGDYRVQSRRAAVAGIRVVSKRTTGVTPRAGELVVGIDRPSGSVLGNA